MTYDLEKGKQERASQLAGRIGGLTKQNRVLQARVDQLEADAREARLLVGALVLSAGGTVRVPDDLRMKVDDVTVLKRWRDEAMTCDVFQVGLRG